MRKNLRIVMFFTIICESCVLGQAPDTVWTRTYGGAAEDDGYSIAADGHNFCIVAGNTSSFGEGISDIWLLKINQFGDTVWAKTFGTDDEEYGNSVIVTGDGGYIITGQKGHFPFHCEVYTVKINSGGVEQWSRSYGGDFAKSIKQTDDGGYVFTGCTPWNYYLVRTDSLGDTLWTGSYPGIYNAYSYDIQTYHIDEETVFYLMVGCTGAGTSHSSWDVYIVKVNSTGEIVSTSQYGDPEYGPDEWANSIEQTTDEKFIIGASTMTLGSGDFDLWLMKIDENGDTLWTRTYGGPDDDRGGHVIETHDGGYIFVGYTTSFGAGRKDVYVVRTDAFGDTIWTKTIGGPDNDCGRRIIETSKGEYIIAGYTESFGAGDRDIYLIKLGPELVGIENDGYAQPRHAFILINNYPDPFNTSTIISYRLPNQSQVTIEIYDILGRKVSTLIDKQQPAGYHQAIWRADDFSSGMYFYKLQAGDFIKAKKMLLLK